MGRSPRVEYRPSFVDDIRSLDEDKRDVVISYMRAIVAKPLGPAPNIRELPPMHKPGTMQASFGDWLIRYVVTYDDGSTNPEVGYSGCAQVIVFIRLVRRPGIPTPVR